MLDDIVDVVAEGKGPKLYDYPLTQHAPWVNVLLVSELKKIVTQQYCMMYSLHVWATDTISNRTSQSALAIESSRSHLAAHFLITFETCFGGDRTWHR